MMCRALRFTTITVGWCATIASATVIVAWIVGAVLSDRWLLSQWLAWIPTIAAFVAAAFAWIAAWRPVRSASTRRRRALLWSAMLLGIGTYLFFLENRPLRTEPQVPTGALTIVHWNISSSDREERRATPERAIALDADIVILTDAYVAPWRNRARERYGESVYLERSNPFGIISQLPILERRPLVAVDRIYALLLRIDATSTAIGREISILAIDLPSELELSRMEIAKRLRELLIEVEGAPENIADIVIGDFNITRGSASLRALLPNMRHAWNDAGRGWSGSYPREFPIAHIDHTFINPRSLRVVDYELLDLDLVRHRAQRIRIMGAH